MVYMENKMSISGLGFDHVSFGINSLFDDTDKVEMGGRSKICSAMKYLLVMTADFLLLLTGMLLNVLVTLSLYSLVKY